MFDWNDIRFFLELARRNKLSAAALRLGVEHTTVARRITNLERELGLALFIREKRSYRLSEDGRRLLAIAEEMERASLALAEEAEVAETGPTGTVRLATPEAFGSQFLAKHCAGFHRHHPGVTLELVAETTSSAFTKREADAAVTLAEPLHGRTQSQRLGHYRLRLYAAPSYLQQHPPIVRLNDLKAHHFIWYVEDLLPVPELQILDKTIAEPNIVSAPPT